MNKKLLYVFLISIFFLNTPGVWAQGDLPRAPRYNFDYGDRYYYDYDDEYYGEVRMVAGDIQSIIVDNPTRVSVRNPAIADVLKAETKEVLLSAKSEGITTLTVWDRQGEKVFLVMVTSQDLRLLQKRLTDIIRNNLGVEDVAIKINDMTGKLTLLGQVNPKQFEDISKIVAPFAEKVENLLAVKKEEDMVEIDVQILELVKNDLDKVGIKWQEFLQFREEPYKSSSGGDGVSTTLDFVGKTNIMRIAALSRDALTAKINMLIQDGKGRELSRPKLLCLSGEEANMLVGGEVPYLDGSTTGSSGTTVSVEYRDYGVNLVIRPIVLEDDKIYLNLKTEITELDWANAVTIEGWNVPAFTKRLTETVLNLSSGDTIYLAGLIRNKDSETIDKLPALGSIPVLGALFRSKEFQNDETELVISLTPKIVRIRKPQPKATPIAGVPGADHRKRLGLYEGVVPDGMQDYVYTIQQKILDNIAYPAALLNTGWEGTVVVKLYISHTGELLDARIVKTSGYKMFDSEAIRLVKSLRFSPFPPNIDSDKLRVEVPIVYKERRR